MKKLLLTISLCSFACLLPPAVSVAVEAPSGWQEFTIQYSFTGSAVKKDMRGVYMPAESVYSGGPTTPGNVAFTCYAGNFSVNVALDPVDMKELMRSPDKSTRRKAKRPDVKINGVAIKNADWIYMPKLQVYQARRKSTAAKFYNSVIRKDAISMRGKGKEFIPLNLPPTDTAFKQFGSECGMGTSANKDTNEAPNPSETKALKSRGF